MGTALGMCPTGLERSLRHASLSICRLGLGLGRPASPMRGAPIRWEGGGRPFEGSAGTGPAGYAGTDGMLRGTKYSGRVSFCRYYSYNGFCSRHCDCGRRRLEAGWPNGARFDLLSFIFLNFQSFLFFFSSSSALRGGEICVLVVMCGWDVTVMGRDGTCELDRLGLGKKAQGLTFVSVASPRFPFMF